MKVTLKIATFLVFASASVAFAHSGATGIVKERMDSMKSIGSSMKTLGGMFAGKIGFDVKAVKNAAIVIEQHAAKIPAQFPKGSDHKPTRALPMVWQSKAEFDKLALELGIAAKTLGTKAASAKSVGDIKLELIAVGSNCKACHKKFRAPEK